MEKKVIKFSLVGVICILLIIAVGIGTIVFALNENKTEEENRDSINKGEDKEQAIVRQNEKDDNQKNNEKEENRKKENKKKEEKKEVTEYKDTIVINGEEQELELKIYKSDLGYKMAYDLNSFYVQHFEEDEYKSLLTDTISLNVIKKEGDFSRISEELIQGSNNRTQRNNSYKLEQIEINGKLCVKEEQLESSGETHINYYIEGNNATSEYFIVEAVCGKELKESMIAVMNKMVSTFVVL